MTMKPDRPWSPDDVPPFPADHLTFFALAGSEELGRTVAQRIRGEKVLQIVPGATHLFPEPGALEQVAALAGDWFERHLGKPEEHRAQSDPGGGGKHAVHR